MVVISETLDPRPHVKKGSNYQAAEITQYGSIW